MSEIGDKKLFSNEEVRRLLIGMFLIGGAWARLEYKMDAAAVEQKNLLREYIIANDKDKVIIDIELANMHQQLDVNTTTIKAITEFIKPNEPEIKRKNYR